MTMDRGWPSGFAPPESLQNYQCETLLPAVCLRNLTLSALQWRWFAAVCTQLTLMGEVVEDAMWRASNWNYGQMVVKTV